MYGLSRGIIYKDCTGLCTWGATYALCTIQRMYFICDSKMAITSAVENVPQNFSGCGRAPHVTIEKGDFWAHSFNKFGNYRLFLNSRSSYDCNHSRFLCALQTRSDDCANKLMQLRRYNGYRYPGSCSCCSSQYWCYFKFFKCRISPGEPTCASTGTFSLSPSRVIADVIDCSSSDRMKIYIKSTSTIPNLFDLSLDSLLSFLNSVKERG